MSMTKSARRGWVTTDVTLAGKTALITGANSGIGLLTAIDLAKRGARVLIPCRNQQKAELAKQQIMEESGSQNVIVKELELASFESIRNLAKDVNETEERLDILINNAGLVFQDYQETVNGFEMQFGVNHLGHFLLTNLLLDLLKKSAPSRIVTVSSGAHALASVSWKDPNRKRAGGSGRYSQSKLMNILFSRELSKRLSGTNVTSNSLHPGIVRSGLFRSSKGCSKLCLQCLQCCFISPEKGAQTSIYCAIAPELESVTGKYFSDCKIARESGKARNDGDAERLWALSEELTMTQEAS